MKYDLVEIKTTFKTREWCYSFRRDDTDRVKGKATPHALGFFHYPRCLGRRKAFKKLKKYMIDRHKKEIKLLQRSLTALKKLEYKE